MHIQFFICNIIQNLILMQIQIFILLGLPLQIIWTFYRIASIGNKAKLPLAICPCTRKKKKPISIYNVQYEKFFSTSCTWLLHALLQFNVTRWTALSRLFPMKFKTHGSLWLTRLLSLNSSQADST